MRRTVGRPVALMLGMWLLLSAAGCATADGDATATDGFGDDGESPQEPVLTLTCDTDLEEMVALLRSGLATFDYEPAATLEDLVERSNVVVTGEVMTIVRFGGHGDGRDRTGMDWTLIAAKDDRLLYTFPEPVPEVPQFAVSSFWAASDPDPIENEVGFDGLAFVAFLNRFDAAPTGYAVDVQGLVVGCSGADGPPVAVIEPLPADGAGLSADDLVAAVEDISSQLVAARGDGLDGPVVRHRDPWANEGDDAEIIGVLELEGECLYLRPRSGQDRYPVVWPALTRWDETRQVVVTPNGEGIGLTDEASGGGGYHSVGEIEGIAGRAAATLAGTCVDNTSAEIAVVNNVEDGIGRSGS